MDQGGKWVGVEGCTPGSLPPAIASRKKQEVQLLKKARVFVVACR